MIENYVTGNKLSRAGVSIDVKNRKLLAEDIKKLLHEIDRAVADGKLENPYIGKVYAEKLGKESWNERHLDKLVAVASSSECFNEDYLLYLAEVKKYVKSGGKRTMKKINAIAITILVCLLAGFIGGFVASYKIPDRYMPGALAKNKNSVAKEDYDKLQKAYDKLDKENAQLKDDKEKMVSSDEYEELKKERDDLMKLPSMQVLVLIRQALAENANKNELLESKKEIGCETDDIVRLAKEMKISKKDMEKLIDVLDLSKKKIDLNQFSE